MKDIFVIGGSGAIGKEIVDYFSKDVKTYVTYANNEVENGLKLKYGETDLELFCKNLEEFLQDKDIYTFVFANGNNIKREITEITAEEWDQVFGVNLYLNFYLSQFLINYYKKQGKALNLIYLGSIHAKVNIPKVGMYSMAKQSLEILSRQISVEEGEHNIRCNVICPSYYPTNLNTVEENEKLKVVNKRRSSLGVMPEMKELLKVVEILHAEDSKISGQNFVVDNRFFEV